MRIAVRHATTYRFDPAMRFVTQSHRLHPSRCDGQVVERWEVGAEGATFGAGFTDGAGDYVNTMSVAGPVERVEVVVDGVVETRDMSGVLRGHRELVSPRIYLEPTGAIGRTGALSDLAQSAMSKAPQGDGLALAHRLSGAVADAIAYRPGTTHAHTTAAEALENGEGVCQDMAHVLIALAQVAGLPARYAVGYLLARDDGTPEEASHAWAEIHVAGLGWVGFDPANRCCPDDRYVRIGSGRDARRAAPIRGVSRGGGAEDLDVSVTVAAAQQ